MIRRVSVCIILIMTALGYSFAQGRTQTVVVLPFINNGAEHEEVNGDIVANYIYIYLKTMPNYQVIPASAVVRYARTNSLNTDDLYTLSVLGKITSTYKADFVLGGDYRIERKVLKINLEIFGNKKKFNIPKYFEIRIKNNALDALNEIIPAILDPFIEYDPGLAVLIVTTDTSCKVFVDDQEIGRTSRKFFLKAGDHDVEIVYEDDFFRKTVFEKRITFTKGSITDLGDIEVLVGINIRSNVKADVYVDEMKLGTTDCSLDIPYGNDYLIRLVYKDEQGDNRVIEDVVSTETSSAIEKYYEFPCRIRMLSGELPLSGRIRNMTESERLPHLFDNLTPGEYRIQMLVENLKKTRSYVLFDDKITLNAGQTVVIDKGDYEYKKNLGLCFVPSAAQFYNHEHVKGAVVLTLSLLSVAEVITMYFVADNYYKTVLEPRSYYGSTYSYDDYLESKNMYDIMQYSILGGIILFGGVYIYSCVDGIITMYEIFNILYNNN